MLYEVLKTVHWLALVMWIGGMMFVQWFLRPALLHLTAQQRIVLMHEVLRRFLNAVLYAILLLLGSGAWMIALSVQAATQSGVPFVMPLTWNIMVGVGLLMVAIFLIIRGILFRQLGDAVKFAVWDKAAELISRIRRLVMINLLLGIGLISVVRLA
jgi:uncharacterized membrane protein